jgi:hypothetical protein
VLCPSGGPPTSATTPGAAAPLGRGGRRANARAARRQRCDRAPSEPMWESIEADLRALKASRAPASVKGSSDALTARIHMRSDRNVLRLLRRLRGGGPRRCSSGRRLLIGPVEVPAARHEDLAALSRFGRARGGSARREPRRLGRAGCSLHATEVPEPTRRGNRHDLGLTRGAPGARRRTRARHREPSPRSASADQDTAPRRYFSETLGPEWAPDCRHAALRGAQPSRKGPHLRTFCEG